MLTKIQCDNAKPKDRDWKLPDARGLFLLVRKGGSKVWRFQYRFDGKVRTMTFGRYGDLSLAEARRMRDVARHHLSNGVNPATADLSQDRPDSFEKIGREWLDHQRKAWSPGYTARVLSRVEADLFAPLGSRPINEITAPEVLDALRAVEARGAIDMAKRVRQYASAIFVFGIATGRCDSDPAAGLEKALSRKPPVRHQPRLKADELPEFFRRLHSYDGQELTRLLLELVVHTFVRTKELRSATWDEVSGDEWRPPGAHMKMGVEHVVPLTRQTKALFARLREITPGERIAPVSENTLIYAMYRMGYRTRATVHGFRGTASTILNESGLWSRDAIELQLAHVEGNAVRRAYNAAQRMDERRRMMQWWSDYLEARAAEGRQPPQAEEDDLLADLLG